MTAMIFLRSAKPHPSKGQAPVLFVFCFMAVRYQVLLAHQCWSTVALASKQELAVIPVVNYGS